MKNSLLHIVLLTLLTLNYSFAQINYIVVSNKKDSTLTSGKYVVEGILTSGSTTINEAVIVSQNRKTVNSDKMGKFKIILDTADRILTVSRKGFHSFTFYAPIETNQHRIKIKAQMVSNVPIVTPEAIDEPVCYKPVIYAYSEKPIQFDLTINPTGTFTFTYPQIDVNNTWAGLKIADNGKLYDQNGKQFPYLFWESVNKIGAFGYKKEHGNWCGSVVAQQNIIAFLENKLKQLGLTATEQTDFITFWGPRMAEYSACFVQFLIDEEYDQVATLQCNPAPESCKRIYVLFTGFESASSEAEYLRQNCVEQQFTRFERKGFTLLEWGGSQLGMQYLKL